jgi:UDP-N-acetylmuramoylalanine--D-glutamate ligase
MQPVRELEGIKFVNDSKATTLTALAAGLRMCTGKVRLIAGGLLKEDNLSVVKKVLAERASAIYLIGRASETMFQAWSGTVSCVTCETMDRAVAQAWRDARAGETVLLSPGCASFDQFRNYAERGDRFKNLVQNLTGRNDRGK